MDDTAMLNLAADLARQAGATILAVRARGFEAHAKPDASPVTEADHAAEALIVAGLRRLTPDIPVVAEEEIAAGHVPVQAAMFWLVDPLDGTKEFAAAGTISPSASAWCAKGRAVLGAVGVPAHGEVFGGILGQGAWKSHRGGGACGLAARTPPAEGLDRGRLARIHGNDRAPAAPFSPGGRWRSRASISARR